MVNMMMDYNNIQLITVTVYICYFLQTFLITSFLSFAMIAYYESEREIMYSLASMILVYLCIYPFFIYMKLDFIGTAFILVYVGAVAILFVFVIMTLEIKKIVFKDYNVFGSFDDNNLNNNGILWKKLNNFFSILLLIFFGSIFISLLNLQWWLYPFSWVYLNDYTAVLESLMYNKNFLSTHDVFIDSFLMTSFHHSINSLGSVLYTSFYIELYIFSFVLFIAMVGSIVFFSKNDN